MTSANKHLSGHGQQPQNVTPPKASSGLRSSAVEALIWGTGFTLFRDLLQFGTMIIIVRLLTPEIYGQASMAQLILGFLAIFSFRNLCQFALQSRDPTMFDWKTHFTVGVLINVLAFCITTLTVITLIVAGGDGLHDMPYALAVMSLSLLLEPFALGYSTYLQAFHDWRSFRLLMFSGAVVSSVGGALLAYAGAGVYALALMLPMQHLPYLVAYISRPHPLQFSLGRLSYGDGKRFGMNRVAAGVFDTGTDLVEQTFLSSMFGFSALGLYTRSVGLANMTGGRFGSLIIQALYPVLTRAEAGSDRFRRFSRILISGIIPTTLTACAFLALEAELIVQALYGDQWIGVARYLPLASAVVATGTLNVVLNQILLANLQQGDALKVAVYAGLTRLGTALLTLPLGVMVFLGALLFQGTTVVVVNVLAARRGGAIDLWPAARTLLISVAAIMPAALLLVLLPTPSGSWYSILAGLLWQCALFSIVVLLLFRLASPDTVREFSLLLPDRMSRPIVRNLRL